MTRKSARTAAKAQKMRLAEGGIRNSDPDKKTILRPVGVEIVVVDLKNTARPKPETVEEFIEKMKRSFKDLDRELERDIPLTSREREI